jgi:methylmalonyl-CoA mutase cobalamin-binding subunit
MYDVAHNLTSVRQQPVQTMTQAEERMDEDTMDTRPRYTIGAVSQRTGLSTHVIRAWERRYDVVTPFRTPGGARLYSVADLFRLRLLRRATESGLPIGTIADLPLRELESIAGGQESGVADGPRELPPVGTPSLEAPLMVAIESMDAPGIQAGLRRALAYHGARDFVKLGAVPLLRRVGELWEDGTICPAQEHLFSVQLRRELQSLLDSLQPSDMGPALVATTLSGETHELGAMLAGVIAAREGWRVIFTGPDLPPEDIATAARASGASAVAISAVGPVSRRTLVPKVRRLAEALSDVTLILGGEGAAPHANAIEAGGAVFLPDLDALAMELRRMASPESGARMTPAGTAP